MNVPAQSQALIGTVYAEHFMIEGFIASGVMGSVYRAKQLKRDRLVALKVINADLIDDSEIVARFHREMRVTAAIKHPNTVRVHQYGHTKNGELYLAMELLEGKSLDRVMADEGPMSAHRVAVIAAQIAAALSAAHKENVVHRDLKPENIIVQESEEHGTWVKVLDFGLAHVGDSGEEGQQDEQLTAFGARVGTPYYMAPEYVQTFELDHRSDLYAVGVLMYEMLTGRPPFQGGPYEVLHKHVKETVPSLRSANSDADITPWIERLIMSLLEKSPDDRPSNGDEIISQLKSHCELPELPADRLEGIASAKLQKRQGGSERMMMVMGAALIVVGVAVLGMSFVVVALGVGLGL